MLLGGELQERLPRHLRQTRLCKIYGASLLCISEVEDAPNGTITISGDIDKAIECEKGNAVFAELVIASEELERLKLQVDPNDTTMLMKPMLDARDKFQAAQETKRISLVEGNSSKTATIGANMDPA